MSSVTLPVGIRSDIDECFRYTTEATYQDRAHDYIERYQLYRTPGDTAVQCTVADLCSRAFEEGYKAGQREAAPLSADQRTAAVECAMLDFMASDDVVREVSDVAGYETSTGTYNKFKEVISDKGHAASAFIRSDRVFVMKEEQ